MTRVLDRHVNVFWGLNGSGKTTLLRILHAALNNDASELEELPFESAEVVFHSPVHGTDLVRTWSRAEPATESEEDDSPEFFISSSGVTHESWVVEEEPARAKWQTRPVDVAINEKALTARYAHSYLPISRVVEGMTDRGFRDDATFGSSEAALTSDERFVRQVRRRWIAYSTKSVSSIKDIQQQGLATVLALLFGGVTGGPRREVTIAPAETAYELVKSFLEEQRIYLAIGKTEFIRKYEDSEEHQQVVSEIQDVDREIDEIQRPQREFQAVIDEMYVGNKHLLLPKSGLNQRPSVLRVRSDEQWIPLKSLSSGEKQLLQVLLEALAAEQSTVMIDEPELSLHVDWQQRLVSSMQRVNSECQLLLATHSPEVMVDVPDRFVFEL